MDGSVLDAVMASLTAAVGTYGQGVLTRGEDAAAEGTVRLGQRLLARLRRGDATRDRVDAAVADLAGNPDDEDFLVALRAQVKKALQADPDLGADLEDLVKSGGAVHNASGVRSVAAGPNSGIISTGDGATNRIGQ